jgi:TolA protein
VAGHTRESAPRDVRGADACAAGAAGFQSRLDAKISRPRVKVPIPAELVDQRQLNAVTEKKQAEQRKLRKPNARRLEEKRKAEEQRQAEAEAKQKVEQAAQQKAEQAARQKAETERKHKAELEAKQKAEQAAKQKAEQAAKQKAESEQAAKQKAEAKRKAEAEQKRKAAEAQRREAEQSLQSQLAAEQERMEAGRVQGVVANTLPISRNGYSAVGCVLRAAPGCLRGAGQPDSRRGCRQGEYRAQQRRSDIRPLRRDGRLQGVPLAAAAGCGPVQAFPRSASDL